MKLVNNTERSIQVSIIRETSATLVGEIHLVQRNSFAIVRDTSLLDLSGSQSGALQARLETTASNSPVVFLPDGGTGTGTPQDDSQGDGRLNGGTGPNIFRAFNHTDDALQARRIVEGVPSPLTIPAGGQPLLIEDVQRVEIRLREEGGELLLEAEKMQ